MSNHKAKVDDLEMADQQALLVAAAGTDLLSAPVDLAVDLPSATTRIEVTGPVSVDTAQTLHLHHHTADNEEVNNGIRKQNEKLNLLMEQNKRQSEQNKQQSEQNKQQSEQKKKKKSRQLPSPPPSPSKQGIWQRNSSPFLSKKSSVSVDDSSEEESEDDDSNDDRVSECKEEELVDDAGRAAAPRNALPLQESVLSSDEERSDDADSGNQGGVTAFSSGNQGAREDMVDTVMDTQAIPNANLPDNFSNFAGTRYTMPMPYAQSRSPFTFGPFQDGSQGWGYAPHPIQQQSVQNGHHYRSASWHFPLRGQPLQIGGTTGPWNSHHRALRNRPSADDVNRDRESQAQLNDSEARKLGAEKDLKNAETNAKITGLLEKLILHTTDQSKDLIDNLKQQVQQAQQARSQDNNQDRSAINEAVEVLKNAADGAAEDRVSECKEEELVDDAYSSMSIPSDRSSDPFPFQGTCPFPTTFHLQGDGSQMQSLVRASEINAKASKAKAEASKAKAEASKAKSEARKAKAEAKKLGIEKDLRTTGLLEKVYSHTVEREKSCHSAINEAVEVLKKTADRFGAAEESFHVAADKFGAAEESFHVAANTINAAATELTRAAKKATKKSAEEEYQMPTSSSTPNVSHLGPGRSLFPNNEQSSSTDQPSSSYITLF